MSKMKKPRRRTVEEIVAEHRELLMPCLRRGFTVDMLTRAFIVHRETEKENALSLPDFFRAINEGKFDYLLKDSSGQSLS